jgi:hypothetical protein
MTETNKLTPVMKKILESLSESPKKDSELIGTIPNFSLELLGKLIDLYAIDHHGHIVYITSVGIGLLNNTIQIDENTRGVL